MGKLHANINPPEYQVSVLEEIGVTPTYNANLKRIWEFQLPPMELSI
jgi:hypothetical protein